MICILCWSLRICRLKSIGFSFSCPENPTSFFKITSELRCFIFHFFSQIDLLFLEGLLSIWVVCRLVLPKSLQLPKITLPIGVLIQACRVYFVNNFTLFWIGLNRLIRHCYFLTHFEFNFVRKDWEYGLRFTLDTAWTQCNTFLPHIF